ncbi:hypothetical protein FACS18948_6110 [Clostridia bacterium]|nr:hypothetical protein FACS18948_6110 [Clostridia bacterium]
MTVSAYNRDAAVAHAHEWAFKRDPSYLAFDGFGGDCTSFVSQSLFASGAPMNYTYDYGWYYISPENRAAAWAGVSYLHTFLTTNEGIGPFGAELPLMYAQPGDIIQFNLEGEKFQHSTLIVSTGANPDVNNILLTAHSADSDNRPMNDYKYYEYRLIHILGIRS